MMSLSSSEGMDQLFLSKNIPASFKPLNSSYRGVSCSTAFLSLPGSKAGTWDFMLPEVSHSSGLSLGPNNT